jgi:hypothetical protein
MLACATESSISLWRLLPRELRSSPLDDADAEGGGWEKLLDMDLSSQTNLVSSSISNDGRWLIVSDLIEPRFFSLRHSVCYQSRLGHRLVTGIYRHPETSSQNACALSRNCCSLLSRIKYRVHLLDYLWAARLPSLLQTRRSW